MNSKDICQAWSVIKRDDDRTSKMVAEAPELQWKARRAIRDLGNEIQSLRSGEEFR